MNANDWIWNLDLSLLLEEQRKYIPEELIQKYKDKLIQELGTKEYHIGLNAGLVNSYNEMIGMLKTKNLPPELLSELSKISIAMVIAVTEHIENRFTEKED